MCRQCLRKLPPGLRGVNHSSLDCRQSSNASLVYAFPPAAVPGESFVGIYDRYVLPRLIDFACGMGDVMKQRSLLVPRRPWAGAGDRSGHRAQPGLLRRGEGVGDRRRRPGRANAGAGSERAAQIGIPVEMVAPSLARSAPRRKASTPSSALSPFVPSPRRCRRWARCVGAEAWRRIAVLRAWARAGRLGAGLATAPDALVETAGRRLPPGP